jgi:predicted aldo/keto reductase-like oxidoreductase
MQYADLGKTGYSVSRLGFGAMRLPTKGDRIDRGKAIPMVRRAIELGVNLIDTAAGYNAGDSERLIGEAIAGLRQRLVLSTKNPHYDKRHDRPWWANLEGSLKRLGVEAIDLYHFHFLNWDSFQNHLAGPDGQLRWARKALDQGLIRHIGFSFHDKPENLLKLADTGEFEDVILQYNLIDRSNEKGIESLARRGMGVIVMGPVGGGRLGESSKAILKILPEARSVPEVALRFVLANGSVHAALSGMSTLEQVEENARVAQRTSPLTAGETRKVHSALARYKKLSDLYCTGCNYCMPCPWGVEIPANFSALNSLRVYDLPRLARQRYSRLAGKGTLCLACGSCMSKCPQHINIVKQLQETVRTLDDAYGKVVVKFEPVEVLSVRSGKRASAVLRCRMESHNLSDQEAAPRIEVTPGPGTAVAVAGTSRSQKAATPSPQSPCVVPVTTLAPFARSQTDLLVELDSIAGGGRMHLKPSVAAPLEMVCATSMVSFAIAPRTSVQRAHAPTSDFGRSLAASRGLSPGSAAVEATHAHGAGKQAARVLRDYGLSARFAHDEAGITLQFIARGPFTATEEKSQVGLSAWQSNRIVISLDLDRQTGIRRLKSSPAAADLRLFLTPGRFDFTGIELSEEELRQVRVRWSGSPSRRRITARIPWKVLRIERPKLPARLGLGFRLVHPRLAPAPSVTLAWTEKTPGYLMLTK